MNTARVLKRSSRLRSRELSTNIMPEKKLRSRKVTTINQNKAATTEVLRCSSRLRSRNSSTSLQKTNVNAAKKELHASAKDVSINISRPLSKRLRRRQNKIDYCEDSKLLQQHILPKHRSSLVILDQLDITDDKKIPIYKTIKYSALEDKDDVYNFKFDVNDSKKKVSKKNQKKKNINKAKGKVIKKTVHKKPNPVQPKTSDSKVNESPKLDINLPVKIDSPSEPAAEAVIEISIKKNIADMTEMARIDTDIQTADKSTKNNVMDKIEMPTIDIDVQTEESTKKDIIKTINTSRIDTNKQIAEKSTKETIMGKIETPRTDINDQIVEEITLSPRIFAKQTVKQDTMRPKIVSIENADNITVAKSPLGNSEKLQPFRSKNIFDNKTAIKQNRNTLNYSLLTKSLSPIIKAVNPLDFESPWRSPTLPVMFSQAKHFFQSTPNVSFDMNKENTERNKQKKMNKENMKMDKENMETNKENKCNRYKERKKQTPTFHKNRAISRKILVKQTSENIQAAGTSKYILSAPTRLSFEEIKNLLKKKSDINMNNKEPEDEVHAKVDESSVTQSNKKHLVDAINFSDTFDVLSETERLSNIDTEVSLFVDLEPSHFSKPPERSYKRRHCVKFDFLDDSVEEEEKENINQHSRKKKKVTKGTKLNKEHEKKIDEWIKTVNSTFEEIDKYDLLIE